MPDGGVQIARIIGVGGEVNDAGEVVFVESFLPGFAAVGGFVNATMRAVLGDREDGMADDADDNDVRIARVDEDGGDVARVVEADVRPGGAGVSGFVDAIAGSLFAGA